jgi:hypothetical protein
MNVFCVEIVGAFYSYFSGIHILKHLPGFSQNRTCKETDTVVKTSYKGLILFLLRLEYLLSPEFERRFCLLSFRIMGSDAVKEVGKLRNSQQVPKMLEPICEITRCHISVYVTISSLVLSCPNISLSDRKGNLCSVRRIS